MGVQVPRAEIDIRDTTNQLSVNGMNAGGIDIPPAFACLEGLKDARFSIRKIRISQSEMMNALFAGNTDVEKRPGAVHGPESPARSKTNAG